MIRPVLLALLTSASALAVGPAPAASSTSSAVSDGVSASVGSVSTSFEKSSASSSGGDKKAEGPYRIVEIADAAARPGLVRLALKALRAEQGGAQELVLFLPQSTAQRQQLEAGAVVVATPQAYGVQFALARAGEPFYLVLDDAWFDALQTTRVRL